MKNSPHLGAIVCQHCQDPSSNYQGRKFVKFAPKPEKLDGKPKRSNATLNLLPIVRDAWNGEPLFCVICLRDERYLPDGVWMEAQHILENQDGGLDEPANLMPVCIECHRLIHWRRSAVQGTQVGKEQPVHVTD